jgi:hypothetical protein
VIVVTFNGQQQDVSSIELFSIALDQFDRVDQFELWLSAPRGQSICMLRSGSNAWLMYLGHSDGDGGFTSQGETGRIGVASYKLSNGQIDEYPLSRCIEVEQCYKALAYFFVNEGSKPEWVSWHES